MNDNEIEKEKPLTKKEKADAAGKDVAEVAARGAARYYGGSLGGAAVDAALKTKAGQKIIGRASKEINKNPITRNVLAKNQENISRAKPVANSLVDQMGGSQNGAPTNGPESTSGNNTGSGNPKKSFLNSLSNDDKSSDNNSNEGKTNEGSFISGLWNKLSLKAKLIIIGIIISFVVNIIFIVILITPLINLGIIDISFGGSSGGGSVSNNYSSVSGNTTYWWPVGSNNNDEDFDNGVPVETTISSEFGMRVHPISGEYKMHTGVDISDGSVAGTTNIVAVKDGTVTYPSNNSAMTCPTSSSLDSCGGGYGNYVMIQHSDGTTTLYAHMHQNTVTVKAGDKVKQGQVIGKMGSSGNSTGTHLHFEVRVNGSVVEPLNYVSKDNPRPKGATSTYVSGNSNKQSVCLTLKATGFSDNAVAAVLTNINSESSFSTTALGDDGTSYGLCQWHNGRYDNLKKAFPDSYQTVDSQIEFLMYELKNKYTGVYNALDDGSDSATDLAYKFCANFEIPYDTENTCKKRASGSDEFYNYVNNGCN